MDMLAGWLLFCFSAATLVELHALLTPERAGLLKPCPVNFLVVPSSAAATTDAFAGV